MRSTLDLRKVSFRPWIYVNFQHAIYNYLGHSTIRHIFIVSPLNLSRLFDLPPLCEDESVIDGGDGGAGGDQKQERAGERIQRGGV